MILNEYIPTLKICIDIEIIVQNINGSEIRTRGKTIDNTSAHDVYTVVRVKGYIRGTDVYIIRTYCSCSGEPRGLVGRSPVYASSFV